jgi:hypothetical protein
MGGVNFNEFAGLEVLLSEVLKGLLKFVRALVCFKRVCVVA